MRAIYFALPAGLILAGMGAVLMYAAKSPAAIVLGKDPIGDPGTVRHLVTDEMTAETARRAKAIVPTFTRKDSEGKTVSLGSHRAPRPQFVYFVLDGCPCSYDAEPLFHKLYKRFKGKVDFASVTDATPAKAHEWSVQLLVNYPVVPDPNKEIIRAYGAKASVYSMLLDPRGRVVKMWPGYSAGLLQDINATMAKEAGVPVQPFDPEYAPKVKATGCAF